MWLKWIFDRVVALIGLLVLWPVLLIVAGAADCGGAGLRLRAYGLRCYERGVGEDARPGGGGVV